MTLRIGGVKGLWLEEVEVQVEDNKVVCLSIHGDLDGAAAFLDLEAARQIGAMLTEAGRE